MFLQTISSHMQPEEPVVPVHLKSFKIIMTVNLQQKAMWVCVFIIISIIFHLNRYGIHLMYYESFPIFRNAHHYFCIFFIAPTDVRDISIPPSA